MPRLLVVRLVTMLTLAAGWFAASAVPAHAADPAKTLRVSFAIAETSFDPAFASDAASDAVIANIMEEGQARWLAFLNRELDFLDAIPVEFTEQALANGKLGKTKQVKR